MIRIRVGASWQHHPETPRLLGASGGAAGIVDVLAIEVDGVDIAGGHTEGALFPSMEAVVRAAAALSAGSPQASVPFQDGAVELVLRRRGQEVLISIVALRSPARILVRDIAVDLEDLASAARTAASDLLADAAAVHPAILRAAHARRLRQAAQKLARTRVADVSIARPDVPTRSARPRTAPGPSSGAPSAGFELRDEEGLIEGFGGGPPDIASLLVPGRVHVHAADGEELLSVTGIVFLVLRDLVAMSGRLAGAARSGETRFEVIIASGDPGGSHTVRIDLARGDIAVDARPARPCPPLLLARALLEAALDFCGAVAARNPHQASNAYVEELHGATCENLDHVKELIAGDLVADPLPARTRRERGPSSAPLGPGRLRHLGFRPAWRAQIGGPGTLWRIGDRIIASSPGKALCIDRHSGAVQWEWVSSSAESGASGRRRASPADGRGAERGAIRSTGAVSAAISGGALLLAGDGHIESIDLSNGRRRWNHDLAELRSSVAPVFASDLAPSSRRAGRHPVPLALPGAILAVDPAGGEVAWRFEAPGANRLRAASLGPVTVVAADTGFLYGLDSGGRIAWRHSAGGAIAGAPVVWRDRCVVIRQTPSGCVVLAVDAATGRRAWSADLEILPSSAPVPFAGMITVAGTSGGEGTVAALDRRGNIGWIVPIEDLPGARLAALGSTLVAKDHRGGAAAIDRRGRRLWRRPPDGAEAHPPPGNVAPVIVRSTVFVASERVVALDVATGMMIGIAPSEAPVALVATDDLSVVACDAEGTITASRLTGHLSVV